MPALFEVEQKCNNIQEVLPLYLCMSVVNSMPPTARLADAVAAELEQRILEGSLKPGQKLPSERVLSLELGVSRPSLREAIQKLASKGLLTTRHGGGTTVTDLLESHFSDPWQAMARSHPSLRRDMLEFRQMLESQAAQLAAERATDVDIERLDAAHARLAEAYRGGSLALCIDADVEFHQTIAEAAHNVLLGHLTASLMRVIHGHVSGNLEHLHAQPQGWEDLQVQHRAIWQAIRRRQPQQAALAASAHIEFVRENIEHHALFEERRQSALRRTQG